MVPYLKGIHLTVDVWRPRRDSEGWKDLGFAKWSDLCPPDAAAPTLVRLVGPLEADLAALDF